MEIARATCPAGVFIGKPGTRTWLHINPPVPDTFINQPRLHPVLLRLVLYPGARLEDIHIWDGHVILERHSLEYRSSDREEMWIVLAVASKRTIAYAPEISLGVNYTQGGDPVQHRRDIISAAIDLLESKRPGPIVA